MTANASSSTRAVISDILARKVAAEHIDLSRVDFVVMSHRHGDHMGGLAYVLKVNPTVKIYAPKGRSGVYGDDQPSSTWYRPVRRTALPQGNATGEHTHGSGLARR